MSVKSGSRDSLSLLLLILVLSVVAVVLAGCGQGAVGVPDEGQQQLLWTEGASVVVAIRGQRNGLV